MTFRLYKYGPCAGWLGFVQGDGWVLFFAADGHTYLHREDVS